MPAPIRSLSLLVFLSLILLFGCKENMYSNLPEEEANQMLSLLLRHNIDASKKTPGGSGDNVIIKVEESQFPAAVELLKQNGFPRKHFATVEQLFPQDGLVATPTQEKARLEYSLSQSLAETLNQIDGVITARVHLVIPESSATQKALPSSAAVFVKHTQNNDISQLKPEIKSLIQSSIEGLEYDDVKVVLVESDSPPPELLTPDKTQNKQTIYLYGLIILLTVISIAMAVTFTLINRKYRKQQQEVLENVTMQ